MENTGPYRPPASELSAPIPLALTPHDRRALVPTWIKVFGWLFIIMGATLLPMGVVFELLGLAVSYSMFGLSFVGSPLHPTAIFISSIIMALAVSAYGLLFGRSWGLRACLVTGYAGLVICVVSMCYGMFFMGDFTIRLEPLVQIPYLIRLHRMKPQWG